MLAGVPSPTRRPKALRIQPEPTFRKPVLAFALCGAMLLVPLALAAPPALPANEPDVLLTAGWPNGVAIEDTGIGEPPAIGLTEFAGPPVSRLTTTSAPPVTDAPPSVAPKSAAPKVVTPVKPKVVAATAARVSRALATTTTTRRATTTSTTKAVAKPTPTTGSTATTKPTTATSPAAPSDWDRLADCESGNRNDPGDPYYGYWQISAAAWVSVGEKGLPDQYSRAHQLAAAKRLQAVRGWGAWATCARQLGLLT